MNAPSAAASIRQILFGNNWFRKELGRVSAELHVAGLLRISGGAVGIRDQGTQDIGHQEFTYAVAGHARGWREAETDWQGQRLNAPLIAFQTSRACKLSGPRVFVVEGQQSAHSSLRAEEG